MSQLLQISTAISPFGCRSAGRLSAHSQKQMVAEKATSFPLWFPSSTTALTALASSCSSKDRHPWQTHHLGVPLLFRPARVWRRPCGRIPYNSRPCEPHLTNSSLFPLFSCLHHNQSLAQAVAPRTDDIDAKDAHDFATTLVMLDFQNEALKRENEELRKKMQQQVVQQAHGNK